MFYPPVVISSPNSQVRRQKGEGSIVKIVGKTDINTKHASCMAHRYFKASVDSSSYHLKIKWFKNRRIEDSKNLKNAASLNRVKPVLH